MADRPILDQWAAMKEYRRQREPRTTLRTQVEQAKISRVSQTGFRREPVILDTDTLTLFQNGQPVNPAAPLPGNAGHTVALTVITVEEQINGWFAAIRLAPHRISRRRKNSQCGCSLIFPRVSADRSVAQTLDALVARKPTGQMDLRIAHRARTAPPSPITHAISPRAGACDRGLTVLRPSLTPPQHPNDALKSSRKSMKFHLLPQLLTFTRGRNQ